MILKVDEPGDLCRLCVEGWSSPHNKVIQRSDESLADWDLERMIATQESGDVPGQRRWEDNELPIGDSIDNLAR